jgi:RNA polymerase sigma-70 factor (ECF subfamily)
MAPQNFDQSTTDEELMLKVKAGRKEAFSELVHRYMRQLYDFAYFYLRDHHITEEVVQEIFLAIYTTARKYTVRSKLRTLIYKIARNHCLNVLKKKRAMTIPYEILSQEMDKSRPESHGEFERKMLTVKKILDSLKPVDREIVILRFFQEMPFGEIAQVVNMAESHVRTRLTRALAFLRENFPDCRSIL